MNLNTLESLRVTLQHLEQTTGPSLVAEDFTELRRILLNRIAELEATPAGDPSSAAPASPAHDRLGLL